MSYDKIQKNIKYLKLLSKQYPTIQSASTEIINLQAILGLPKGTEHFISDLHGEHEAFEHIMNNASGMIREKIDNLFEKTLSSTERRLLSTLIYYPEQKLEEIKSKTSNIEEWYRITLSRLIEVCRKVSSKYTRSKVRKALPIEFEYIIDELLHTNSEVKNKEEYYSKIISTIIEIGRADAFINALCKVIKRLVVDRLHIVGDIYDRGPRPDKIMDKLIEHHSVDIQWGNHDILWMGSAAGSAVCIATVLNNSMRYNNLDILENAYGINLRPLALFAGEVYKNSDCSLFEPRCEDKTKFNPKDIILISKMYKAMFIIQLKLESQVIKRHPEFHMEDRLLLDKINFKKGTVLIEGIEYKLKDCDFPTIDPNNPSALTKDEEYLMSELIASFKRSDKLQRHANFLFSSGSIYKCCNGNLLYHSSIPLDEEGDFLNIEIDGDVLSGKAYLDRAEAVVRIGYNGKEGSRAKAYGEDYMWFLWCGKDSPLFGRKRITTFERIFINEKETHVEPCNDYYKYIENSKTCRKILREFGLPGKYSHIINGHTPICLKKGEKPVKANGKLIVIDGGFCKAYQKKTGTAGYTLFYNSYGLRLVSHEPFESVADAIKNNRDIISTSVVSEFADKRITVADTDVGKDIAEKIEDLKMLLAAYRTGVVKETNIKTKT